jgi:hypothetical protein
VGYKYTNPKLLARVLQASAEMKARGEWRGLRLPGEPPAPPAPIAPPDEDDEGRCRGCKKPTGERDLTEVRNPRLGTLRFCAGCFDKWQYSHRWRDAVSTQILQDRQAGATRARRRR